LCKKETGGLPALSEPVAPSRENVINLMDALRRSIAAEPPAKKSAAASKAVAAKRRTPPAAGCKTRRVAFCCRARNTGGRIEDHSHRVRIVAASAVSICSV
jgi:hypothetical protein